MNRIPALIEEYQAALRAWAPTTLQESTLLAEHEASLQRLMSLLAESDAHQAMCELIEQERRSYGWSFLSGMQGEKVEQAFNTLANAIEQARIQQ